MIYRALGDVAYLSFRSADEILKILTKVRDGYCKNCVLQVATLPVPIFSLLVEYALSSFLPAMFPLRSAAPPGATEAAGAGGADLSKVTVEPAEDVGSTLVIESGTVKGDSVATAMLLNEICASLQKKTGTKVARVMHSRPVDASAPILSVRMKESAIRCNGKLFTPADVPKLLPKLSA
jgi:hypothetical protein